jgi:hypothetical protein
MDSFAQGSIIFSDTSGESECRIEIYTMITRSGMPVSGRMPAAKTIWWENILEFTPASRTNLTRRSYGWVQFSLANPTSFGEQQVAKTSPHVRQIQNPKLKIQINQKANPNRLIFNDLLIKRFI